ncbi:MAG: hypothetical protein IH622_03555 [Ochrobactrum anthropi]|uniref:Uncharacterized protein n=1 Tax=Brucella anthropi TaxID=529 RepID=A0A8I0N1E4_BRUAN|nr:hypothetical protein [Brucella anthropi]MBE0559896.1 hypothetical protein [Brucella anthropi]
MATLAELRQKYPQYQDMSDQQVADAFHKKFYSDMPKADFYSKLGIASEKPDAFANDGTVGPTLARGGTALPDQRNADGTYGQPPEGMVFNPETGQMEDLSSSINPNIPTGRTAAAGIGLGQGAGFGLLDEATAALTVPFGGDYDYNLGRLREAEKRAAADHAGAYYGGMIGGGVGTGVGLAKGGVSLTANAMNAGKSLGRVAGASALEGALLGAGQGFGSGENTLDDRAISALKSGGLGLAIGGAAPYAIAGLSATSKPVVAPMMARLKPQKYADAALDTALERSGTSVDRIARALENAHADGQDMFSVADAMGHQGRRMLSTVVRTPNDARQEVFEQLVRRQTGQGDRLVNALTEGFGASDTAMQRVTGLTTARDALADANYAAARSNAGAVDIAPVIQHIDDTIRPGVQQIVSPADDIAGDSIERALTGFRARMTDGRSNLTDFNRVLTLKKDVSDAVEAAKRAGQGNRARMLGQLNNQLDRALENASPDYRAANDTFKSQSKVIEAVETGKNAASSRMRAADNIDTFTGMGPGEQSAFRSGYADPWIARLEAASTSPTTNKARMLITDKTAAEFPAFAMPSQADQMARRVAREQKMFTTANEAMGGSKTADNLADMADMANFDPSIFSGLMRGSIKDTAVAAFTKLLTEAKGTPKPVIQRLAKVLMETDPTIAKDALSSAIAQGKSTKGVRALVNTLLNAESSVATPRILGQERRPPLEIKVRPNR